MEADSLPKVCVTNFKFDSKLRLVEKNPSIIIHLKVYHFRWCHNVKTCAIMKLGHIIKIIINMNSSCIVILFSRLWKILFFIALDKSQKQLT